MGHILSLVVFSIFTDELDSKAASVLTECVGYIAVRWVAKPARELKFKMKSC